ncbi:hypothetical protein BHE74_00029180 [Ensete ventricosum]|nr:hypothetical protein GW17_00051444 [Ensete ventricosum]RWW63621.1 hypothetical protein BHE74_00029180 [Ensete ventricosum]RZR88575.1 hypothetical protein BHM03_00016189 [Ensete ventricosum]
MQYCRAITTPKPQHYRGTSKTVGRWLKDRREKKKEETRAQNAQLHAAISVAGVAAAVAAVAAATAAASGSGKDDRVARIDMAVASAATLVAAQCVEAAESMGAEREHLASVVGSAVNVRTPGDIARALKDVWNIAAVIPVEKGAMGNHNNHHRNKQQKDSENNGSSFGDEFVPEEDNFLGLCSQEFLAKGTDLLKRTRKGVVVEVCKEIQAWPGRHLLQGGEQRRYFGLRTAEHRVIEFECLSQREHEMWTQGVSRLLNIVNEKKLLT